MEYLNKTNRNEIKEIILRVKSLLKNEKFYDELIEHIEYFACSSASVNGFILSEIIREAANDENIKIELHVFWHWKKKVVGKFNPKYPNRIYFNSRNLDYKIKNYQYASISATIIHELIHLLDNTNSSFSFGHCGQNTYSKWMEGTAPYFADKVAEKFYSIVTPIRSVNEEWITSESKTIHESWVVFKNFLSNKFF